MLIYELAGILPCISSFELNYACASLREEAHISDHESRDRIHTTSVHTANSTLEH